MTADQFKELRLKAGLSQPEWAVWLNSKLNRSYDQTLISKWENGSRDIPDFVALFLRTELTSGKKRERKPERVPSPPLAGLSAKDARVIALSNQKGGVGKTASAVNLAAALAAAGKKTLLVDLDPQANATTHMGANATDIEATEKTVYYTLLKKTPLADIVVQHSENLFFAPSSIRLADAELELTAEIGNNFVLKEKLAPILQDYSYIIIDCGPNIGLLLANALMASSDVLIPCQSEMGSVQGINQLLSRIDLVKQRGNPTLNIFGILPTLYDGRNADHKLSMATMEEAFGTHIQIFPPIPRATIYGQSYTGGVITLQHAPDAPGIDVYRMVANRIIGVSNVAE